MHPAHRRRPFLLAAPGLAAALLLLGACGGDSPRLDRETPVVLISIDTLRADRLPAYGHSGVATPAIDRLAADGIVFDNAYSHSPLTLPSHVSALTGLLPSEHRVRDNMGYPLPEDRAPLVQRAFLAHGYRTGGFVSSYVLRRGSGIASGFEVYDDGIDVTATGSLAMLQRRGEDTFDRAVAWLDTVATQPFLLFFHLYEPHSPYDPPEPFASRYASAYDGEVAAADAVVGRLLERLDRAGLYDRALIVLFSDHGEGLGQHGEQEHGVFLYRSTIQVPLILKLPEGARSGARVGATVQLSDLAPTLLELAGLDRDPRQQGQSLLAALGGSWVDRPVYSETFYPRLHFGWSEIFSVVEGRHHFIEAPRPELYDLVRDPGETSNLAGQDPQLDARLTSRLDEHDRTLDTPEAVSAETLARLAALGYVGTAATAADESLPDPKGQIGALGDLRRAATLFEERRYDEAVPVLRGLIAEQPRILDAWDYLARSLDHLGRVGEALRVYEDALARFPGTPLLSLSAAQLDFRLGRFEEAAALAEAATPVDPAAAHALLSQIALRRGDLDGAERRALLARETGAGRLVADLAWADVLIARERFADALALLDAVKQRLAEESGEPSAPPKGLDFLRGKALARMGRAGEAEEAFAAEIQRYPFEPQAYTHLALMYGLLGMQREAAMVIGSLIQANGSPYAIAESIKTLDLVGAGELADKLVVEGRRRHPDDPGLRAVIEARRR